VQLEDLGEQWLKGMERPIRVCVARVHLLRIRWSDGASLGATVDCGLAVP
jgi:hypothetical protein